MSETVTLYVKIGRAPRQPVLTVDKNDALINEKLMAEKMKWMGTWASEGRDTAHCAFELEGV